MVFRRARRQPSPAFDLTTVAPPYRPAVDDAMRAKAQFDQLVASIRGGPLQDRLHELGGRVDAGVRAVWETARRMTELELVVQTLDPDRITGELKHARRTGADHEVVDALAARFASTQRLLNALDDQRDRLPVLEARLATAVARAAELALTTSAPEMAELETELDTLVLELDALGQATAELR